MYETAKLLNITLEEGIPTSFDVYFEESDPVPPDTVGPPKDLTGYRFLLEVREEYESETALISLSTENGAITVSGGTATVTFRENDSKLGGASGKNYVYDLVGFNPSDVPMKILMGGVQIVQTVSRW